MKAITYFVALLCFLLPTANLHAQLLEKKVLTLEAAEKAQYLLKLFAGATIAQ